MSSCDISKSPFGCDCCPFLGYDSVIVNLLFVVPIVCFCVLSLFLRSLFLFGSFLAEEERIGCITTYFNCILAFVFVSLSVSKRLSPTGQWTGL